MLKLQLTFDRAELTRLLTVALSKWSGKRDQFDSVTINCDGDGRASGYAFVRTNGKATRVNLTHAVVAAGIGLASAAEGNPIAADSLVFSYIKGSGYGGSSSVKATADPATQSAAPADNEPVAAGSVKFPGTVTVSFDPKELVELFESATKRSGYEPTYTSVYYNKEKGTSATIRCRTKGGTSGILSLAPADVIERLTAELTARGYTVAPDGFRFSYQAASFGGSGGTSVEVTLSALPV